MIRQFARCIYRWILVIGFLLPLTLAGPVWIYWRFTGPASTSHTEFRLFPFVVGVALGGGLWNFVPFLVYKRLSRSGLAVPPSVEPHLGVPRWAGIIGAGVALFAATAAFHAMVLLDVFISQPLSMSRYALGYPVIILLVLGMMLIGYVVGWVAGSLFVGIQWVRRRRN